MRFVALVSGYFQRGKKAGEERGGREPRKKAERERERER